MPIGLVEDNDFEKEINGSNSGLRPLIIDRNVGRGVGNGEIGLDIKKLIIDEVIENNVPHNKVSEILDVSKSTISATLNGSSSTASYGIKKPELLSHISKVKTKIS